MSIKARGEGYWLDVSVTRKGKKVRHREMCKGSHDEAKARHNEIQAALLTGQPVVSLNVPESASKDTPLLKAIIACEREYWGDDKRASLGLRNLAEFSEEGMYLPITKIDLQMLLEFKEWLAGKGLSDSTIRNRMASVSKMLTHFAQLGEIAKPHIPRPKGKARKRLSYLTVDQTREMVGFYYSFNKDAHDWFVWLLDTGMRPSEARSLRREDVEVSERGDAIVHITFTKNTDPRSLPLTRRALMAWQRQLQRLEHAPWDNPWDWATNKKSSEMWDVWRAQVDKADDEDFVPYMLRHTCATHLYDKTRDLILTKEWMGHRRVEQTMTYAKLFPDALQRGREALSQLGALERA